MQKYEIWYADLPSTGGSHVQRGRRPVIIVSNDTANRYSPVVTVVPLTTRSKPPVPTNVCITGQGLDKTSTALCDMILTIDKSRFIRKIGFVYDAFDRLSLHHALCIQLGMAA